ncbi:MAG: CPBP family intramembrane metalloprotease [Chloroflexaceae bacterium]|nr:CPBP family intramembrane metalloprotease [Chloroflexaceae bacterium]
MAVMEEMPETMLLTICPRIGAVAPRLCSLCGNHPLALEISASLLADDPYLSVEAYLQALEDELAYLARSTRMGNPALQVQAVLTTSYEALTPNVQTIFCQLGVFQASFDQAAAVMVVARSKRTRKRTARLLEQGLLDRLCRRKLLQGDQMSGRYCMPEPVRSFAANRLEHAGEVFLRYARYYLGVAHQAATWCQQHEGEVMRLGEQLFAGERPNIEAGWHWAIQQPPHRVTDELIVGYSLVTAPVSNRWYDQRHERVPQLQAAIQSSIRLGWSEQEAAFRDELGKIYTDLGELQLAIACYTPRHQLPRSVSSHRTGEVSQPPPITHPPPNSHSFPSRQLPEAESHASWHAWGFLSLVGVAGLFSFAGHFHIELIMHAMMLLGLYSYAVSGHFNAERLLAIALTLVPLVRIISIGTMLLPLDDWLQSLPPVFSMPFLIRDTIAAFLLFIAVNVALWNLGIPRRELGVHLDRPVNYAVLLMTGVGLGVASYLMLAGRAAIDTAPLSGTLPWDALWFFLALFPVFAGVTMELIFRGCIQTAAQPVLGKWSFLYGAVLFATMYAQHQSLQIVAFAFLAGIFLAYLVDWSRLLLVAMVPHSLFAVVAFFAAPKLTQSTAGGLTLFSSAGLEQVAHWSTVLSFTQVLMLLVLLIQKEIFNGLRSIRSRRINRALNIALYPLFLLFLVLIVAKFRGS